MADSWDKMFGPARGKEAPAKGLLRPSYARRTSRNVDAWFDVDKLWVDVSKEARQFRGGKIELPLVQITHPGLDESSAADETAYYFGLLKDVSNMDSKMAWSRVLIPFLDEAEETLNSKKPKELGGRLRFDVAKDQSLTLFYMDK